MKPINFNSDWWNDWIFGLRSVTWKIERLVLRNELGGLGADFFGDLRIFRSFLTNSTNSSKTARFYDFSLDRSWKRLPWKRKGRAVRAATRLYVRAGQRRQKDRQDRVAAGRLFRLGLRGRRRPQQKGEQRRIGQIFALEILVIWNLWTVANDIEVVRLFWSPFPSITG